MNWTKTRSVLIELQNLLTCGICNDFLKDPCTLRNCDHNFCRKCIENFHDESKCPECGLFYWAKDLKSNNALSTTVSMTIKLQSVIGEKAKDYEDKTLEDSKACQKTDGPVNLDVHFDHNSNNDISSNKLSNFCEQNSSSNDEEMQDLGNDTQCLVFLQSQNEQCNLKRNHEESYKINEASKETEHSDDEKYVHIENLASSSLHKSKPGDKCSEMESNTDKTYFNRAKENKSTFEGGTRCSSNKSTQNAHTKLSEEPKNFEHPSSQRSSSDFNPENSKGKSLEVNSCVVDTKYLYPCNQDLHTCEEEDDEIRKLKQDEVERNEDLNTSEKEDDEIRKLKRSKLKRNDDPNTTVKENDEIRKMKQNKLKRRKYQRRNAPSLSNAQRKLKIENRLIQKYSEDMKNEPAERRCRRDRSTRKIKTRKEQRTLSENEVLTSESDTNEENLLIKRHNFGNDNQDLTIISDCERITEPHNRKDSFTRIKKMKCGNEEETRTNQSGQSDGTIGRIKKKRNCDHLNLIASFPKCLKIKLKHPRQEKSKEKLESEGIISFRKITRKRGNDYLTNDAQSNILSENLPRKKQDSRPTESKHMHSKYRRCMNTKKQENDRKDDTTSSGSLDGSPFNKKENQSSNTEMTNVRREKNALQKHCTVYENYNLPYDVATVTSTRRTSLRDCLTKSSSQSKSASFNKGRNKKGETPLHLAAIKGDLSLAGTLINEGADLNVKDHAGWTPLHEACNHGHLEVAKLFLDNGAMINTPGHDNVTPLHDAVANGRLKVVKLLVDRGAVLTLRNRQGLLPIDYATTKEMKSALTSTAHVHDDDEESLRLVNNLPSCSRDSKVILGSGLKREQQAMLKYCVNQLGGILVENFDESVTHIVISADENGYCPRTMKYMYGLLTGKWIVNFEWVMLSLPQQQWLDETVYEVKGSSASTIDAAKKARLNMLQQMPRLLDGCSFYLRGTFNPPTLKKNDLIKLINLGGGKVLHREPKIKDDDMAGSRKPEVPYHAQKNSSLSCCTEFILFDSLSTDSPKVVYSPFIKTAPVKWLMDCISSFKLLDIPNRP
ncbi:ankyrin repeat domain-containing protein 31-like [Xenia sp. Carnegie-2017]|uniref:ankyrin repeat domain-containing protein 31-like n=1 Tax=Xenia sp. Carnegie-2017 TaxID=2897299 RepID=UPI001F04805F|nr:ankyrin repeat domain-containing protein 31-like [Xenia sp. Carnegie-2017]